MTHLRLATRGFALALAQSELVAAALRAADPAVEVEFVEVHTEGDADRRTPLSILGGRGVFVRAVEEALLEGRADIAMHSLKDVPTTVPEGLVLGAFLERGDPRDVLVASGGRRLRDLPPGAVVGTSSNRRAALLHALRPDLDVRDVRGNVDTRVRRVAEGAYDAVLIAAAGLDRLGRLREATQLFEAMEFLPAPGQGTIVVECRAGDDATRGLLDQIDHAPTRAAAIAERSFLAALGSGCTLPVGAYAQVDDGLLVLRAMVASEASGTPFFGDATGPLDQAEALGRGLGERLLAAASPDATGQ
ncbi:MAG: hydroxymethylbilane synthase [Dehalococcoidia bacterium]|nr:hydroxymethylbilane synthase [Dehalococcoidia bacterium]